MIETIEFNGKSYPAFQASGNAARFIIPFAQEVCKGDGLDIGYSKSEWKFPNAIGIDNGEYINAMSLPKGPWDYIFSSHCLEHIETAWPLVLDYWKDHLKSDGTLFLYLPHVDQEYWWPINDKKHLRTFHPIMLTDYFNLGGWINIFVSQRDLNHSFVAMAQKT